MPGAGRSLPSEGDPCSKSSKMGWQAVLTASTIGRDTGFVQGMSSRA